MNHTSLVNMHLFESVHVSVCLHTAHVSVFVEVKCVIAGISQTIPLHKWYVCLCMCMCVRKQMYVYVYTVMPVCMPTFVR